MPNLNNPIFLSYSSNDRHEVNLFDLELRRRGVPLWRDRTNLGAGTVTEKEIEEAAEAAGGFVFYLSKSAAESEWVREKELFQALDRHRMNPRFRIVPVFRDEMSEVVAHMKKLAAQQNRLSDYDLRPFNGVVIDPERAGGQRLGEEMARAAGSVLDGTVAALAGSAPQGGQLRVGLATRRGLDAFGGELDLLMDWTPDFERQPPNTGFCRDVLEPALKSFRDSVREHLPKMELQVTPACHLTMALAFGFRFRRNEGVSLKVQDAKKPKLVWQGPAVPAEPLESWWKPSFFRLGSGGDDIALVINLTQPRKKVRKNLKTYLESSGPSVGRVLYLEPRAGTGPGSMPAPGSMSGSGLNAEGAHRLALGALKHLAQDKHYGNGTVHLFLAAPVTFAVLLGQQLSNLSPVQSYEWSAGRREYAPSFRFESS